MIVKANNYSNSPKPLAKSVAEKRYTCVERCYTFRTIKIGEVDVGSRDIYSHTLSPRLPIGITFEAKLSDVPYHGRSSRI